MDSPSHLTYLNDMVARKHISKMCHVLAQDCSGRRREGRNNNNSSEMARKGCKNVAAAALVVTLMYSSFTFVPAPPPVRALPCSATRVAAEGALLAYIPQVAVADDGGNIGNWLMVRLMSLCVYGIYVFFVNELVELKVQKEWEEVWGPEIAAAYKKFHDTQRATALGFTAAPLGPVGLFVGVCSFGLLVYLDSERAKKEKWLKEEIRKLETKVQETKEFWWGLGFVISLLVTVSY